MMSSNKTTKHCSSCEYWAGERKLNSMRTMVEFQSNTKGKCIKGHGSVVSHGSTCRDWKAWGCFK